MTKKIWTYLGYLLLIPSLLFGVWQWQENKKVPEVYTVENVLDGDTFVIEKGLRIKLNNLDAPELGSCGGSQAKEFLESLVAGKKVGIKISGADSYQRPLAWAYQDGRLINKLLVSSGWAEYSSQGDSGSQTDQIRTAGEKARETKVGIFENCVELENTANPQCTIKGSISENHSTKIYHFPGCGDYDRTAVELFHGDQWFCSEKEAQTAGFVKSKNCFDKSF